MHPVCRFKSLPTSEMSENAEFRKFTSQYQPEKFFFVDESSKDDITIQIPFTGLLDLPHLCENPLENLGL